MLAGRMLVKAGLVKYDADHPRLDAGVLSIRDFLLATQAAWLVTCRGKSGGECRGCFRANSYFTKKIVDARRDAGRPSLTAWFSVTAADLTAAAPLVAGTVAGGGEEEDGVVEPLVVQADNEGGGGEGREEEERGGAATDGTE